MRHTCRFKEVSKLKILRGVVLGISMFSRIPVPQLRWNEENMRYLFCGFPLVGVFIGLFIWLWTLVCSALNFGFIIRAAGITLIPAAVSGGVHLEGFCDVSDALASRAEPEKKRQIMKDPHIGAFAAISLGAYFLIYFALCCELPLDRRSFPVLVLIPVLSRSLSGLSAIFFPTATDKGLLRSFKDSSDKGVTVFVLATFALLSISLMTVVYPLAGLAAVITSALALLLLFFLSQKQFGGMSGDLSGWFLCIAEIMMLAGLTIIALAK